MNKDLLKNLPRAGFFVSPVCRKAACDRFFVFREKQALQAGHSCGKLRILFRPVLCDTLRGIGRTPDFWIERMLGDLNMSEITKEIERRRTFAIISHPDAGKTTLTEKFLLYGGAINQAG